MRCTTKRQAVFWRQFRSSRGRAYWKMPVFFRRASRQMQFLHNEFKRTTRDWWLLSQAMVKTSVVAHSALWVAVEQPAAINGRLFATVSYFSRKLRLEVNKLPGRISPCKAYTTLRKTSASKPSDPAYHICESTVVVTNSERFDRQGGQDKQSGLRRRQYVRRDGDAIETSTCQHLALLIQSQIPLERYQSHQTKCRGSSGGQV